MNFLHFLVFFGGGGLVILFAFNVQLLDQFGRYFGVARGVDLFVYMWLILLFYFYIDLYNKHIKDVYHLTRLVTRDAISKTRTRFKPAIEQRKNTTHKDEFVFLVRAYNEQKTIGEVIDTIFSAGFSKILVVNDWSTDNTPDIVEQKIIQYPNNLIILLSHTINRGDRGAGAATKTGYSFLQKYGEAMKIKWMVGFDADGQHDIHDMKNFLAAMEQSEKEKKQIDLFVGSRFVEGGEGENMPVTRKRILAVSRMVTLFFYGTRVSDPHNGYRVISLAALKKFSIMSDGMHYANEINEQIKQYKLTYVEVPVHVIYSDYSLQKGQKNTNSIRIGLEMIYRKIFFR